ncbi:MAG: cytochrome c maturation protein CcmE [Magnetococcales bacterium]|nr:cytochrome c maturation protein CcmE [Magnetococcales bacterium]
MTPTHRNRLLLLVTLMIVGGALLTLVLTSFTDNLVYFQTPTEIFTSAQRFDGRKVRIGGMVRKDSFVKTADTLEMRFIVTDGRQEIAVRHHGLPPTLFREGQGVIVEGIWQMGSSEFVADTILAKHSEDYVPVEMSEQGIAQSRESLLKTLR